MRQTVTEQGLHAAVARFLDWCLLPPAVWTTFPAGWYRLDKAAAGRLKHVGLKPGMPDILIWHGGHCYGVELKTAQGKLTMLQSDMHARLAKAGVKIIISRRLSDVIALLRDENIPFRKIAAESLAA